MILLPDELPRRKQRGIGLVIPQERRKRRGIGPEEIEKTLFLKHLHTNLASVLIYVKVLLYSAPFLA